MSTAAAGISMTVVTRKVQAYFAPAATGSAALPVSDWGGPPPGWADLGCIQNLRRLPGTGIEPVRAGAKGAIVAQFAASLDTRVEFDFLQWGKLQMALSACGPQLNVLAGTQGAPTPSVMLMAGSSATQLRLSDTTPFSAGDLLAVDIDYAGQTGNVGSGIPGAYVKSAADVNNERDYIRRVTLNVGRASSVTPTTIVLEEPLLGGAPLANAGVQKVAAFLDREGGSFFSEWSAIFVMDSELGARISFQYPRLQVAAPAQENSFATAPPLETIGVHASFRALPQRDPVDGEQVLCYRAYSPAPGAAVY